MKSRDPGLDNKLFRCLQNPFFLSVDGVPELCSFSVKILRRMFGSCFKFAGSGWETLMQVWITGYRGFLPEAIGLLVDNSDEAELYFLFRAANCHCPIEAGVEAAQGTRSSCDLGRKVLS